MKIGFVVNTIDAEFGLQAGGHLHIFEIAKRVRGNDIVLFVPSFVKSDVERLVPGADVVTMPSLRCLTSSKMVLFAWTLVSWPVRWRALRSCDVLYASSHFLSDTIPVLIARGRRSIVVIFHLVDVPWRRPGSFFLNLIAYITERVSLIAYRAFGGPIVVVNPQVGRELMRMKFSNPIVESTCGVDPPSTVIEYGLSRELDAIFVGRLSATKGLVDLINLWAKVIARVPTARLRIVGDGAPTFVAELRRLVGELSMSDNVIFAGRLSEIEKWTALRNSALFVFPSKEEGWGIALAEAMACGLPCVAYDLEAYRSIFPTGLARVPLNDVAALADAVIELLESASKRHELAAQAYELAKGFDWNLAMQSEVRAIELASNN